jgi:hypothetical protein
VERRGSRKVDTNSRSVLIIISVHQILLTCLNKGETSETCSKHGGDGKSIQNFIGKPEGGRLFGRPDVDGRIILRWIFKGRGMKVWTELHFHGVGSSGGFF